MTDTISIPSIIIPNETTEETKPKRTRRAKTTLVNKEDVVVNEAFVSKSPSKVTEVAKRKRNNEDKSSDKATEVVKKPRRPPTYTKNRECICQTNDHFIQIGNNIVAYFRSQQDYNTNPYTLQDLSNLVFQVEHLLYKLKNAETIEIIQSCLKLNIDDDDDYIPSDTTEATEVTEDEALETNSLIDEEL